jgi:tetratricopeptide (TPR) repeat protein
MNRLFLLVAFLILCSTAGSAQNKGAMDSLWNIYQTHPNDTTGLLALELLAGRYLLPINLDSAQTILELMKVQAGKTGWKRGDFLYLKSMAAIENRRYNLQKSLSYGWQAARLAERNGYPHGAVYGNLGGTYSRLSMYDSAIIVLNKALEMARAEKHHRLESQVNLNLAAAFGNKGSIQKSVQYNIEAAHIADQYHERDLLAPAYRSLLISFASTKDTARLMQYAHKLIQHAEQYNNPTNLLLGYLSLSNYWEINDNYKNALTWIDKAAPLLPKVKTPFETGQYWLQKANCYSALGQRSEAIDAWQHYASIPGMTDAETGKINIYTGLGLTYERAGVYPDSVVYYYNRAIDTARYYQAYEGAARAYKLLALFYAEKSADFPKAYSAYIQYKIYEDSLLNADKVREITAAELNFSFERERAEKDKSILSLENKNLASELRIRQQTDQLFRNKTEAEKRNILLQLLNRDNQIQVLSLQQKDDSLATQQLRLNLEQADKTAQLTALRTQQEIDTARRNRLIGLLAALLALAGLAFYIFRLRQKAANDRKMAEVEMRALRAQMNPHFLFNSMNAINSYIVRNDTQAASEYLSRFAHVMRKILESAQHPTVTLEKEIELLIQYLQMEQKRIEQGFDFNIQVADNVDTFETSVPSMILQPFIENAVIHGIRPKTEGRGILLISISRHSERLIRCVIEDNGVGRPATAGANGQKSMGLKITADRLSLWHQDKTQKPIVFTDLKGPNGQPAGTKVEVLI